MRAARKVKRKLIERGAAFLYRRRNLFGDARALAFEEWLLRHSWTRHTHAYLREYLVQGRQDPRVNLASILGRHNLIRELFGGAFSELMDSEVEASFRAQESFLDLEEKLGVSFSAGRLHDASQRQLVEAFERLLEEGGYLQWQSRWREALTGKEVPKLSVIEVGCGSANDYRLIDAYGIGQHLQYKCVDLNEKNIANVREMFPDVDAEVGNICQLNERDDSYDWVIVHDVFEHLSLDACASAFGEVGRIAARGAHLFFFGIADVPDHQVRQIGAYHDNRLSLTKVREQLLQMFPEVVVTHLPSLAAQHSSRPCYPNEQAYEFVCRKN